jgi:hypothetical protein
MIEKPATFRTLIQALGGVKSFADAMGLGENTAKKMRDRSSVATDHWPKLIRIARANGFLYTTDDFVEMASKRQVEKRKAKAA